MINKFSHATPKSDICRQFFYPVFSTAMDDSSVKMETYWVRTCCGDSMQYQEGDCEASERYKCIGWRFRERNSSGINVDKRGFDF